MKTKEQTSIAIREVAKERGHSSSILKVARHFGYVRQGEKVLDLADKLLQHSDIRVLAVCDAEERLQGIISREQLFALVGKPFAREVLLRCPVEEICEQSEQYHIHQNLYEVANSLHDRMDSSTNAWFPLVNSEGVFKGCISTQELASHLARMTSEDIELAGQLQLRLMESNEMPKGNSIRAEAWSRSAKGVGGDFWFSRDLGEGRHIFALCDVSGKGVSASLVVSMVWGVLRSWDFSRGLRQLVINLNSLVIGTFQIEKYLTGIFLIWDSKEEVLRFVDMGHSHALMVRSGKLHNLRMTRRNLPLGIEPSIDPAVQRMKMKHGDHLLLFSDGITEQQNTKDEEYGEKRLARTFINALGADKEVKAVLPEAIDAWRGPIPQQDDMSCICLHVGE